MEYQSLWELVLLCVGVAVKRKMYQRKIDVDMLNAVQCVGWRSSSGLTPGSLFFLIFFCDDLKLGTRPRWNNKAPSARMRFHLKTQTFCCVFMSRPHENDENDVSFPMKTQTFENALQSGKIWKREYRLRVWKRKLLNTISHVISVPVHLHSKHKDGEYPQRTYCCFYWYLAPIKLDCELAVECLCS